MTTPQGDVRVEEVGSVGRGVEVLAGLAVGGRVDSVSVLVLRAVRRIWFPSLVLGLAWLLVTGGARDVTAEDLDTVAELLGALLSPLAGIALAVAVRLLAGALGFLVALPRARAELIADHERRRAILARGADLFFLAAALRSLRFTAAARDVAARRLSRVGRVALVVDRVETWLGPASAVALALVLVVRA